MKNSESRGHLGSEENPDSSWVPVNFDTIQRGMVENNLAKEVPVFWDETDEFVHPQDVFMKAWNQFQEYSYTDLLRLKERLDNRVEETVDAIFEKGGDFLIRREKLPDDNEEGSPLMSEYQRALEEKAQRQGGENLLWLYRAHTFYYRRKHAASALARYIEEKGSPPGWEGLTEQERNRLRSSGRVQPRHRTRVKAVLQNLDPQADAKEIFQDAADQLDNVGTSRIRKQLKQAFEEYHSLEGRLNGQALCKYAPREAERIGILVEEHIPPEAEEFEK